MDADEQMDSVQFKKQSSYTYWVNNDPSRIKIDCTPKEVKAPLVQQVNNNGSSQWNTMGTWEERIIKTDDIKKVLEAILQQPLQLGNNIEVPSIKEITGEANIVMSRGKKRMGYSLAITFEFQGLNVFEDHTGQIVYSDYSDDGEREYSIKFNGVPKLREQVIGQLKANIEKLNQLILNALEQMKV